MSYFQFKEFAQEDPDFDKVQYVITRFEKFLEQMEEKDKDVFPIGKYRGEKIQSVLALQKGRDYCKWLSRQPWFKEKHKYKYLKKEMESHNIY